MYLPGASQSNIEYKISKKHRLAIRHWLGNSAAVRVFPMYWANLIGLVFYKLAHYIYGTILITANEYIFSASILRYCIYRQTEYIYIENSIIFVPIKPLMLP